MSVKRIGTVSAVTGLVAALGVTASAQWGLEDQDQDQQPQQPQQQQREQAPVQPQQQPAPVPGVPGADEADAIEGADIEEATAEQREEADVVIGVMNIQDVAQAFERMSSVQRLVERDDDRGGFWIEPGAMDEGPIDAEMLETARDKAEAVADDDIDVVVAEHLQGQPDNVALVDVTRPVVERIHERTQQYREQLEEAAAPAVPAPQEAEQPQRQEPEREPLELPALPDDDQDDGAQDDDAPFQW